MNEADLAAWSARRLREIFGGDPGRVKVAPLAGDASARTYYRLLPEKGESRVLMCLNDAGRPLGSEEIGGVGGDELRELPFVNVQRHLARAGVAVPTIHDYDRERGLLLLEDLGDNLLDRMAERGFGQKVRGAYRAAVDELVKIHAGASSPGPDPCYAFLQSFDEKLYVWEFRHFVENTLEARRGVSLTGEERQVLEEIFNETARRLSSLPRVFTHRDYHSKNLVLQAREGGGWRARVIDFQDALLGPAQYDLASLLRDSYVALEEEFIGELAARYLEGRKGADGFSPDPETFREDLELQAVQRNMKAIGRFDYIDIVKGNPGYLRHIPRTMGYLRKNLSRLPELEPLRRVLGKYVEELG